MYIKSLMGALALCGSDIRGIGSSNCDAMQKIKSKSSLITCQDDMDGDTLLPKLDKVPSYKKRITPVSHHRSCTWAYAAPVGHDIMCAARVVPIFARVSRN